MCSYQDVTQLVLFLLAAPRCHHGIEEQKELGRRRRIESKERNGREGSGGERWRTKNLVIVENRQKRKKEKADGDEQIARRRKEKIERIESVKQQRTEGVKNGVNEDIVTETVPTLKTYSTRESSKIVWS